MHGISARYVSGEKNKAFNENRYAAIKANGKALGEIGEINESMAAQFGVSEKGADCTA